MKPSGQFSIELQSMRGCAAMIVLLGHCFETYKLPHHWTADVVAAFLNGRGAVTFFFVLSGAVIALSLKKFQLSWDAYFNFSIRRLMRIMPLVLVATIIGTIFCNYIDVKAHYPFATDWFTDCYKLKMDLSRFIASLVGYSARPDPPLWSIFVELLGSAALPFLVLGLKSRLHLLTTAIVLVNVSFLDLSAFKYNWPVFLITFFAGVSILNWGPAFTAAIHRVRGLSCVVTYIGCAIFFLNRQLIWVPSGHGDPITNLIEIVAVAPVIALLLYTPNGFPPLRMKPLVVLGDISFSLYVLHFPILCLIVQLLASMFPHEIIGAHPIPFMLTTMTLLAGGSILLSRLTYQWIELPFARMGKTLSQGFWPGAVKST